MAARITTNRVVVGEGNACRATRGAPGVGIWGGQVLFATDTAAHRAVIKAPAVESAMSAALAGSNPAASAFW